MEHIEQTQIEKIKTFDEDDRRIITIMAGSLAYSIVMGFHSIMTLEYSSSYSAIVGAVISLLSWFVHLYIESKIQKATTCSCSDCSRTVIEIRNS
jgi:hypothetical protein